MQPKNKAVSLYIPTYLLTYLLTWVDYCGLISKVLHLKQFHLDASHSVQLNEAELWQSFVLS